MVSKFQIGCIFLLFNILSVGIACERISDGEMEENNMSEYISVPKTAPTGIDRFIIPDEKLEEIMMNMIKGDGDVKAAVLLIRHFSAVRDYSSERFWYTVGAENGYQEAQYGLANKLSINENDNESMTRSVFWLYKMAVVGYRSTEEWLGRIGYSLETAQPPDDALFSFNYTTLSEEEMNRCKEGALHGNGKAALILAQYYNEVARDTVSAEYWYRIGAQNGNTECQYQYGYILSGKQELLDQERGKFWINRASNR